MTSHIRTYDRNRRLRAGKVLPLLAIALPAMLAVIGLVFDGGLMLDSTRGLQSATDAGATAGATDLRLGRTTAVATATATSFVKTANSYADAAVTVNVPPTSGSHAGQANHIEVIAERQFDSRFMKIIDGVLQHKIRTRSVAAATDSTTPAVAVVLDPDPSPLSLSDLNSYLTSVNVNSLVTAALPQTGVSTYLSTIPIVGPTAATLMNSSLSSALPTQITQLESTLVSSITLPALPALVAGMEIEGLGVLKVDGAILVNTTWGGYDENGELAGSESPPPYGIACMPLIATTRVKARDIRVVGGVDNETFYRAFASGGKKPLQASRLPVPDPFAAASTPSTASLGGSVSTTVQSPSHAVRVALPTATATQITTNVFSALSALLRPLFTPLTGNLQTMLTQPTLQPGVYDSITVISPVGGAKFNPGVYIIRGRSPITQMSLCILGPVQAEGVLFYITDSAAYSPATGLPDESEASNAAPPNVVGTLLPSALVAPLLPTASISGLSAPGSPLDGMLIFQKRTDRRPIILESQQLIGGQISGTVYSKWGHVTFVGGGGSYDLKFVCGTLRIVTVLDTTLAPANRLPAAKDVFLLE